MFQNLRGGEGDEKGDGNRVREEQVTQVQPQRPEAESCGGGLLSPFYQGERGILPKAQASEKRIWDLAPGLARCKMKTLSHSPPGLSTESGGSKRLSERGVGKGLSV